MAAMKKKPTGRSADASAGAAAVKKKAAAKKSGTGARVFSAYGPSEQVGNPGAGVSRRKVVSDYIRGAKRSKKK
jgi:hypothetical protein